MGRRFSPEKLEKLRGRRTQTDLAYALRRRGFGTTQTTVSRWESGQEPRSQVMAALAAELGVKVDELYEGEDDEDASSMDDLDTPLMRAVREVEQRLRVLERTRG